MIAATVVLVFSPLAPAAKRASGAPSRRSSVTGGLAFAAGTRAADRSARPAPPTRPSSVAFIAAIAVFACLPFAFLRRPAALADWSRAEEISSELSAENEQLNAALQAKVAELQASRARIVEAGYEERRRVERDLHDGAQQHLVALAMSLRLVRSRIESDPRAAAELLDEAMDELGEATAELRELARGIHPAVLSDRGLEAALGNLADRSPVPVEIVETPAASRCRAAVESTTYFVVAEALTNVARYAAGVGCGGARRRRKTARSRSRSATTASAGPIRRRAPACAASPTALPPSTASLTVVSPAGDGTVVRARIPLGG